MTRSALALFLGLGLLFCAPMRAQAHPHVFVAAGLEIVFGTDGRPAEVLVTWRYDELYSLLILQDYGLDQDFDMVLTPEEVETLRGFDLNWSPEFAGGLVMRAGGVPVSVGAPSPVTITLLEDGRIESVHRRALRDAGPGPLTAAIFDPGFYVAFELSLPVRVAGAGASGCDIAILSPDLAAAEAALNDALDAMSPDQIEMEFPAVGELFAETARVTCARS